MRVPAKTLRTAAIVALLAIIAAMIYLGCGCRVGWTRETFADGDAAGADGADGGDAADGEADAAAAKLGEGADSGDADVAEAAERAGKKAPAGKARPLAATPKKANETVAETTKRELEELLIAAPKAMRDDPALKRAIGRVADAGGAAGDFSKREMDLFEDLKNNKLSEKDIVNLVKTGVLNEALVEKFLSKLDSTAAQLALEDEKLRGDLKRAPTSLANDDAAAAGAVEGFCSMAPGYAKW